MEPKLFCISLGYKNSKYLDITREPNTSLATI